MKTRTKQQPFLMRAATTALALAQATRRATAALAIILLTATTAWAQTPSGNWDTWVNDNNIDWSSADAKAAAIPQSDDGSTVYISTAEQLAYYAYAVNNDKQISGSASGYYCGRTVELMADIDLSEHYWKPIGWNRDYYFSGYFHGNGHVITGIHVNGDPQSDNTNNYPCYGLFGYFHTRSSGTSTITDLVLKDFSITASFSGNNFAEFYLGGLVGRCDDNTAITNCLLVNGSVSKSLYNSHAHIGKVSGEGSPSTATANYYHNVSVSGWTGRDSYSQQTIGGETEARAVALTISGTHGNVALGGTVGRISGGIIYAPANETVTLNTTTDAGYIASLAATGLTLTSGQFTMPDNDDGAITATISIDPAQFSQSGDTYTIHTAGGWNVFCDALQDNDTYNRFSGKTVRLGADITVTRMAGGDSHEFTGTFDGGGHTLTLAYGTADAPVDAQFVAPFVCTAADGDHQPTFRNLTIDGTIYATHTQATDHDHVSGLIGHLFGTVTIEQCTSLVEIHAKGGAGGFVGLCEHSVSFTDCHSSAVVRSAGGSNSGFVAWSRSSYWNINFTGCLFDGKLLQQNGKGDSNGGFIGWKGDAKTVTITNCLCAPAPLADGETMASSNSATFSREHSDHPATITNSYYTAAFDIAQGKARHTVTAGTDVTVAHAGVATHYATSGITAYKATGASADSDPFIAGLLYNNNVVDVLYAGIDDEVSLTLSNTATGAPLGYQYSGYTATAGTLSGSTLTMPDADVTVSLDTEHLAPIDWATVNQGNSTDPYMIYNKDQLDLLAHRVNGTHGETANDYENKYFKLGADIIYNPDELTIDKDNDGTNDINYEAIGGTYNGTDRYFNGNFDGGGHTVSGIRIYSGGTFAYSCQGLFGTTGSSANIHDVTLADADITGGFYTGGIVGENNGTVSNCHVTASVAIHTVQDNVWNHGGIVGRNHTSGTVTHCTSAATLTIADGVTDCQYYGGIAGVNEGSLTDNLATGAVVPAAAYNTYGAISGVYDGTLENNYYTACTLANVKNATGKGCGGIYDGGDYTVADITDDDGAVPALRDNADNTKAIALLAALASTTDNHTPVDLGWGEGQFPLQLVGRTLYKDDAWNTLCLPFDVTIADSPLAGAEVKTLTGSAFAGGTLTLNFSTTSETTLTAGKPYIIRWNKPDGYVAYDGTNAAECSDLVNPIFNGVTVSTATANVETDCVDFIGILSPTVLYEDGTEKTNLYMGADNKLYYPTVEGFKLNACRGYFKLKGISVNGNGNDNGNENAVRSFDINFGDDATGIVEMRDEKGEMRNGYGYEDGGWYTVDGRRLDGKPTQKGLYIHGGRKVVIK